MNKHSNGASDTAQRGGDAEKPNKLSPEDKSALAIKEEMQHDPSAKVDEIVVHLHLINEKKDQMIKPGEYTCKELKELFGIEVSYDLWLKVGDDPPTALEDDGKVTVVADMTFKANPKSGDVS